MRLQTLQSFARANDSWHTRAFLRPPRPILSACFASTARYAIPTCVYNTVLTSDQENDKKEVQVPDVDEVLMKHMLEFMYTNRYTLLGGTAVPIDGWCNHSNVALLEGPDKGPQIFRRKCSCSGKVLSPLHLLLHVRIYTVADYFDMNDLKTYARQGMLEVLHVYWKYPELELANVLDEAFTATPDEDASIRDVLIGLLREHPGLSVDEGEVQMWLEEHPEVQERVNWD
jgi:hypothetical protein